MTGVCPYGDIQTNGRLTQQRCYPFLAHAWIHACPHPVLSAVVQVADRPAALVKIVIAAWHLRDFNVGLGRYCRELIDAIGRVDSIDDIEVLMPGPAPSPPARQNVRYRTITVPIFRRRVWEQVAPALAGRYDVLHFPHDSVIAWKRGKFVVTVHDLKPLLFPELLRSRPNRRTLFERLVIGDKWSKIDHIMTVSESSRRDLVRHVGYPAERISVVPPGVDATRFRPADRSVANGQKPYVLSVAGTDPTKNVETLIQAFGQLEPRIRREFDLVLTGDVAKRHAVCDLVDHCGLLAHTRFEGVVSDERLIHLYQQAAVFVFPSLYEGFGLPVLEAMACGCPVICSDTSSLPEVAGDAAITISPRDPQRLASELSRVLGDAALAQDLRTRGRAQALRFSWGRTAEQTLAVYRRVVEN